MKIIVALLLIVFVAYSCKEKLANNNDNGQNLTFKNVDIKGAKDLIEKNANIIVLDVRTPGEIAEGKIQNAIEIDYNGSNFDTEIAKLDKSKSYIVYCRSGGRSARASKKMIKAGFTDVTNMKGGYSAWSKN